MSNAARIQNGFVVEVVILPDGVALADAFHPDAGFVTCPAGVSVGMVYAAGEFLPAPEPEPPSEAEIKAGLVDYAAGKRWQIETAGILVSGALVATDRESQGMIGRAYNLAVAEPSEPVDYKSASGWITVDSATMKAIGLAVGRHVRACFRVERAVWDQIAVGAITTTAEIDAAFAA